MKTLTFGQLPAFHEIIMAVEEHCGADGLYPIELNMRGLSMARSLRLALNDCANSLFHGDNGKQGYLFDSHEMVQLLRNLTDASNNPDNSDDQIEWAGDFASGIMFTLGFEWV